MINIIEKDMFIQTDFLFFWIRNKHGSQMEELISNNENQSDTIQKWVELF